MPSFSLLGEEDVRIFSGGLGTCVRLCWFYARFGEEALHIGRILCSLINERQLESVPALLDLPLVRWLRLSSAIITGHGRRAKGASLVGNSSRSSSRGSSSSGR